MMFCTFAIVNKSNEKTQTNDELILPLLLSIAGVAKAWCSCPLLSENLLTNCLSSF